LGGVRVHEGGEASAMGARAYTQGSDLHFAPGAYEPASARGQELIGHELAHVVQQSEGRVTATRQAKGIAINEDDHLEREADTWGAHAGPRRVDRSQRSGNQPRSGRTGADGEARPRTSATSKTRATPSSPRASTSKLTFKPGAEVDATKIGMTQAVKQVAKGTSGVIADPTEATHMVPSGKVGAGHMIDRITTNTNPIYGSEAVGSGDLKDTKETNNTTTDPTSRDNATYKLGHRFTESGALKTQDAWMHDAPSGDGAKNSSMIFETTALALDGTQKGTYLRLGEMGLGDDGKRDLEEGRSRTHLGRRTVGKLPGRGDPVERCERSGHCGHRRRRHPGLRRWPEGGRQARQGHQGQGGWFRGSQRVSYNNITVNGGPSNGVTGYIKNRRPQGSGRRDRQHQAAGRRRPGAIRRAGTE